MAHQEDLMLENRINLHQYLLQNRGIPMLQLVVNKEPKPNGKKMLKKSQKATLKRWGES
jgi:hypothetical protein